MILQRFAAAVRRQDWFQVLIEVMIVIVGIYLGFQVTEWGDERERQQDSDRIVGYLVEDIERTMDYLESRLLIYDRQIDAHIRALEILDSETLEEYEIDDFERGISSLSSVGSIDSYLGSFSEGNIAQIVDNEMRRTIGDYNDKTTALKQSITNNHYPRLTNIIANLDGKIAGAFRRTPNRESIISYDFETLKIDTEFRAYFINLIGRKNNLRGTTSRFLEDSKMMKDALNRYRNGEPIEEVDFR